MRGLFAAPQLRKSISEVQAVGLTFGPQRKNHDAVPKANILISEDVPVGGRGFEPPTPAVRRQINRNKLEDLSEKPNDFNSNLIRVSPYSIRFHPSKRVQNVYKNSSQSWPRHPGALLSIFWSYSCVP